MTNSFAKRASGFSLIELTVVVMIVLILAAITGPMVMRAVATARLRSSGAALAGLMQDARILASKSDSIVAIQFNAGNTAAFVDPSNGSYTTGDLLANFTSGVTVASSLTGMGAPTAYTMSGDGGSTLAVIPGTKTMAFSKRGLPCDYTGGACLTPANSSFVYYLQSPDGWVAVAVTRAGRTRVSTWTGSGWSN